MTMQTIARLFIAATVLVAAMTVTGCSSSSAGVDADAPPAKKPGSLGPPPSNLPANAMKKTGKG